MPNTPQTPQEQFPLFYLHPELWLGAIDVEVVEPYTDGDTIYEKGHTLKLTLDILHLVDEEQDKLRHYKPLFKPQHGEQFIEDLEKAVSAGFVADNIKDRVLSFDGLDGSDTYYFTGNLGSVYVNKASIGNCRAMDMFGYAVLFDTAAYARTLWKLGYYL